MHIMVYYLVWNSVSTKPLLPEIKNQYQLDLLDIRYIIIWAIIEGISYQFVNLQKNDNIWYNIVTFIPVTFLFEIVYDLVFYLHHYIYLIKIKPYIDYYIKHITNITITLILFLYIILTQLILLSMLFISFRLPI